MVILAVVAVSALLRLGMAAIPLERDEGEYAYIAREWRRGAVPYRDAFNQKPPGVFLAYRMLFALDIESVEGIHWMAHAWLAGALVPLVLLGRRVGGLAVGAAAGLGAAVLAMDSSVLGNAGNAELFALLPLSLGVYVAWRDGGPAAAFVAGLCGGVALCMKHVSLPVVLWPIGWLAVRPRPLGRAALPRALAFTAGVGGVLAAVAVYLYLRGAGWEAWDAVVAHNLAYASRVPLAHYRFTLAMGGWPVAVTQWPWWVAAGAGAIVMSRAERRALWPIAAWLVAAGLATSAGGYFRPHYFMYLVPPVALLGASGLGALARRVAGERPAARALIAVLGVAVAAWPVVVHGSYFRARSPELASRELYPFQPFAESSLAADWIRQRSTDDETVFVYGSEPQIPFYAGRRSVSRYIILYPLYSGVPDAGERQAEVVAELERLPRVVVVVLNTASLGPEPLAPRLLETRLREMLRRHYDLEAATVVGPQGLARLVEARRDASGQLRVRAGIGDRPSLLLFVRRSS